MLRGEFFSKPTGSISVLENGFYLEIPDDFLVQSLKPARAVGVVVYVEDHLEDDWGTTLEEARRALSSAMRRYADGDDAAFGDVYDLLAPRLYGFFTRQTGDTTRAEDLVQQTLLQIHAARSSYLPGSDVFPWAFAIGRRLLIDSRRRTRKEVLFETAEDDAAALDSKVERFSVPEGMVLTKELAGRARHELERMPESHRAAYTLVREEGLSIAEAAEVLGATPTAIKLRAHRAYEALRGALDGDGPMEKAHDEEVSR